MNKNKILTTNLCISKGYDNKPKSDKVMRVYCLKLGNTFFFPFYRKRRCFEQ